MSLRGICGEKREDLVVGTRILSLRFISPPNVNVHGVDVHGVDTRNFGCNLKLLGLITLSFGSSLPELVTSIQLTG